VTDAAGDRRASGERFADLEKTLGGKYRVLGSLGQGGFGSVYLVEIAAGMVGEKLALKLLPSNLSAEEKLRNQFINEIRVAMKLVDKYIIQIRDVGITGDGRLYYTMDYSPGETLKEILQREGRLAPPRAIPLVLRVLRGLQTAHGQGVIHRDLKPANLIVESRNGVETVRILDFGIATAVESRSTQERGKFVGSPNYMPPEQFLNEQLGFYTDLYAVGVVLYECLTGQKPYLGSTPQEVFNDMKSRRVVPPDEFVPSLRDHANLVPIILKALERNPENRYQSSKQFFNDLNSVLEAGRQAGALEPRDEEDGARAGVRAPRPIEAEADGQPPRAPRAARRRPSAVARASRRGNPVGALIVAGAAVLALGIVGVVFKDSLFSGGGGAPLPIDTPTANAGGAAKAEAPVKPATQPAPATKTASKASPLPSSSPGSIDGAREAAAQKAREYLASAVASFETGKFVEAREQVNDALALDGENPAVLRLKGLCESKLEFWKDAADSLQSALARLPPGEADAPLYLNLVDALLHVEGGRDTARNTLRGAIEAHPSDGEIAARLLRILDEDGDEDSIVRLLGSVRGRAEHPLIESMHQKWVVELRHSRDAARRERLAGAKQAFAEKKYEVVIDQSLPIFLEGKGQPNSELGFQLAIAFRETGNFSRSLEILKQMAPALGDEPNSLVLVALLYGETHLAAYQAGGKKADLEYAQENLAAAMALLQDAGGGDKRLEARARTLIARCHAHEGNLAKVDEEMKFARRAFDADADLAFHQGESYFLLARATKDETAYRRAINRLDEHLKLKDARDAAKAYYLQGLSYLSLGRSRDDFNQARNRFDQAKKAGLETPELYNAWAEALFRVQDLRQAAMKYRESFNLKPTIDTCYWAAKYFSDSGVAKSAKEILDQGIRLFDTTPGVDKLKDLRRSLGS
jgi:tetratricopeptide (TPR) repeat protein